jgi:hypothetical protein
MLQLRCLPLAEEERNSDEHGFVLEVAGDPQRLLLTLNLCRLLMPPNTAPIHLENWRQIEALVRHLAAMYRQAHRRTPMRCTRCHGRRRRASQHQAQEP